MTVSETTSLDTYEAAQPKDPAGTGFLKLIRAHHSAARRNVECLAVAMQTLKAAKTEREFVELQQQLQAKSLAATLADGETIGRLTRAAFSEAFGTEQPRTGELRAGSERQE